MYVSNQWSLTAGEQGNDIWDDVLGVGQNKRLVAAHTVKRQVLGSPE